MSPPWRDVAIYGTAAAVGVLSAGSIPAGEAANCLKVLLDGRAPNFRSLVARAERALDELIAREHGGEAGFAPVRATVEQLLASMAGRPPLPSRLISTPIRSQTASSAAARRSSSACPLARKGLPGG